MTNEQEQNLDKLLEALRVSDPKVLAIKLMEALGMATMCIHWLRGMFHVLEISSNITMPQEAWNNLYSLRDSIEAYEAFLWRIAPPRAMVHAIGAFRESGYMDPEFELLLNSDAFGRACDRADTAEIRDVLGRVMSADTRITPENEWERYDNR